MDPVGSCEWMDGLVDAPILEDLLTAAAAMIVGRSPSGSCETLDITNNASKEVLETIGYLETILAVMVAGEDIR